MNCDMGGDMSVTKITADQIFLGDSSLKTTKEVFAPNELITSGKCDTIPHDGWEFFLPGKVLSGDYWLTIACMFDFQVLSFGGSCIGGCFLSLFSTADLLSDGVQIGSSLECANGPGIDVVSSLDPVAEVECWDSSLKRLKGLKVKVETPSDCFDLKFFVSVYRL